MLANRIRSSAGGGGAGWGTAAGLGGALAVGRSEARAVGSAAGVGAASAAAQLNYAAEVNADNPKVYYRLDETSGTVVTDSSGNGFHGTYINGPTLDQSPLIQDGRAVSFDGTDDRIDGPAVNLLGDCALEVWYKPTSVSGWRYIISHGASGETEAANVSYSMIANGSSLRMLWESGAGVNTEITPGFTLVVGTRYHIVMERDSVAKTVKTTVNGVVIATTGYTNNPTGGTSCVLGIGHLISAQFAAGVIDEVAIYDHLLGAARVTAHYNAGI